MSNLVPVLVAWLSLLTVLTVFEIVEVPSEPNGADGVGDEDSSATMSVAKQMEAIRRTSEKLNSEVSAAKERLSALLSKNEQEEQVLRSAIEQLRAARRRRDQRHRVEEQSVQLSPEMMHRRRSGFLEDFPHLEAVESLLGRSVVPRSYTAEELRLWRARVDGQLAQLTPSPQFETTFRGSSLRAVQLFVLHLQNRSNEIDRMWPEHFDVNNGDIPIYKPLFAADSVEHPSNADGLKLHLQYNT